MGESRIPSLGRVVAIVGAIGVALALGGVVHAAAFEISLTTPAEAQPARKLPIVLAGDPTPLIPPSMTRAAPLTPDDAPLASASPPAAMPAQPARKMPVAAKREPLAHGAQG